MTHSTKVHCIVVTGKHQTNKTKAKTEKKKKRRILCVYQICLNCIEVMLIWNVCLSRLLAQYINIQYRPEDMNGQYFSSWAVVGFGVRVWAPFNSQPQLVGNFVLKGGQNTPTRESVTTNGNTPWCKRGNSFHTLSILLFWLLSCCYHQLWLCRCL